MKMDFSTMHLPPPPPPPHPPTHPTDFSDIVANLRAMLEGEAPTPMKPWYKGFNGTIEEVRGLGVSLEAAAGRRERWARPAA